MKEDSETPFAFSPNENEEENGKDFQESFFSKNKKLILFIITGVLLVAAVIITIIIIVSKGDKKGENNSKQNENNKQKSDNETSTNFIKAVYNISKISERTKIYNVYTNPPNYYNMSKLISHIKIDDKNITVDSEDGTYQFNKKGIYTVKFYFKETLHYIEGFFMLCSDLIEVDFTNFITTEIESMSSLFRGCIKLKTIIYGDNFNTTNLNDMDELFALCLSLEEIDLTKYETRNVFSMNSLFEGCKNLKKINFGNFNTKRVEEMRSMFNGCSSLRSIDLSKFDTSKVSNFEKYVLWL